MHTFQVLLEVQGPTPESSTLPLLDNEECRGLLLSIIPVATTAQAVQSSEEDKIKVNDNLEETKDGTTSCAIFNSFSD